jgi:hypothetical protein
MEWNRIIIHLFNGIYPLVNGDNGVMIMVINGDE